MDLSNPHVRAINFLWHYFHYIQMTDHVMQILVDMHVHRSFREKHSAAIAALDEFRNAMTDYVNENFSTEFYDNFMSGYQPGGREECSTSKQ